MRFYLALTIALVALVAVNAGVIQSDAVQSFALIDEEPQAVAIVKAAEFAEDDDSVESAEDADSAEDDDEDDDDVIENDDDADDSNEDDSSEEVDDDVESAEDE